MKAIWNGTVVAESNDTVVVEGNHYVRVHGVRQRCLTQHQTSRNGRASRASAGVHQPVGTAASGRGSKLGDVVLAIDANTASCMNFHRSTPWRRQVS